jgi:ABC-type antimicrobial peptide transport system permease subunit
MEQGLWATFNTMIPGFAIANAVLVQGLVLSALLGLLAGALPSLRARRLQPVVALRMEA